MNTIQSEATARLQECARIINTAEYNGINLFEKSGHKFLKEVAERDLSSIPSVSSLGDVSYVSGGTYKISTVEELMKLHDIHFSCSELVLENDIDMSGQLWEPISSSSCYFDGNGKVIKNVNVIVSNSMSEAGFFRSTSEIKNLGIENLQLRGSGNVGGLCGDCNGNVENCYVLGNIKSYSNHSGHSLGGIVGKQTSGQIIDCYFEGTLSDNQMYDTGGIVGKIESSATVKILNCAVNGEVVSNGNVGGIFGSTNEGLQVSNCKVNANVINNGSLYCGGIGGNAAYTLNISIYDCIMNGKVTNGSGLTGYANLANITNCFVLGTADKQAIDGCTDRSYESAYSTCFWNQDSGMLQNGSSAGAITLEELNTKIAEAGLNLNSGNSDSSKELAFQVGIYSDSLSISLNINFSLDLKINLLTSASARKALEYVDAIIKKTNEKQVEFGATQNRLESALEEIGVRIENLTSTRSTIRDADIGLETSKYIQQQILQQAAATLLATANQSPALVLQLI